MRVETGLVEDQQAGAEAEALARMSWVTMNTVRPVACHSSSSRPCMSCGCPGRAHRRARRAAARAACMISAWAMARRCCMPPESWLGYLSRLRMTEADLLRGSTAACSRARDWRRAEQAAQQGARAQLQADGDVVQHAQMREHRVALKDDAAIRHPVRRSSGLAGQQDLALARPSPGPAADAAGSTCRGRARPWCRTRRRDGQVQSFQNDLVSVVARRSGLR